jgi:hypothetical protein
MGNRGGLWQQGQGRDTPRPVCLVDCCDSTPQHGFIRPDRLQLLVTPYRPHDLHRQILLAQQVEMPKGEQARFDADQVGLVFQWTYLSVTEGPGDSQSGDGGTLSGRHPFDSLRGGQAART